MAELIMKMFDRKGDQGKFVQRGATAGDPVAMITFLTGKCYAGCVEYSEVTPGTLAAPKIVVDTDDANNDIDYKASLTYKDYSVETNPVTRRLIIPAPTLNIANGICCVIESDTQAIPAIPPSGAVGKGGNTIISEWETACGVPAGTYRFISGGFFKDRK